MSWTVNDLEPDLSGTLLNGAAPVDLRVANDVTCHIKRADGTTISRPVVLADQLTDPGLWSLEWVDGDLTSAGDYLVECEVLWPSNRPQTFGPSSFSVKSEIA